MLNLDEVVLYRPKDPSASGGSDRVEASPDSVMEDAMPDSGLR
jgi:hypothetical protein